MQTVLVTGSGRGLGLELTKRHVERGDVVYATCRRLTAELKQLAQRFDRVKVVEMDVSRGQSVHGAATEISQHVSHLDIVYSNAGVYRFEDEVPFTEIDFEQALDVYNINALGFLRVIQAFLPLIGEGTMVLGISSDCASVRSASGIDFTKAPRYANYPYYMSKAAMNMAGCLVDGEIYRKGGRLILVHPGWMKTEMGGPNALIPVGESASAIVAMATRERPVSGRFVDYTGKPMEW